jgi:hypothetical protein
MTWPKRDLFAVTVDGAVYVNILALEEKSPPPLALKKTIFVGVLLTAKEKQVLSERLYDAMSEAAAFLGGQRRRQRK